MPKNAIIYQCELCKFECCKKSNYSTHLMTAKHKRMTLSNEKMPKNAEPLSKPNFICQYCNKSYKVRNSFWYHIKKCEINQKELKSNNEILNYLINENTEMKNLVMDVCQKIQPTNIYHNTINSTKTFNLNVFLNDHCKDAMNIMDFVNSLQLELSDLENMGKLGYINGLSSLIIKNLQALDVHKRPVHCSDVKREVMYVKDQDRWEKENEEHLKLKTAIKYIAHKNSRLIPQFKAKYPDCINSESNKSDVYTKIIIESLGGTGENEDTKDEKIIKNIAKEVIINK